MKLIICPSCNKTTNGPNYCTNCGVNLQSIEDRYQSIKVAGFYIDTRAARPTLFKGFLAKKFDTVLEAIKAVESIEPVFID